MRRTKCLGREVHRGLPFGPNSETFFNVVMDDQRDDKWDKLMEKEEKGLRNMLINYILSGGGGLKLKGIYLHMFKSFNRAGCCAHF